MVDLTPDDKEYVSIVDEMQGTIREHRDGGAAGGIFKTYNILKVKLQLYSVYSSTDIQYSYVPVKVFDRFDLYSCYSDEELNQFLNNSYLEYCVWTCFMQRWLMLLNLIRFKR